MTSMEIAEIENAIAGFHGLDEPRKMNIFEATMIAEGNFDIAGYEPSEEVTIEAWQMLIDTGTCWQLQGWFGRQATALIEAGICTR